MRSVRLTKKPAPAGYQQFWESHPPVVVVNKFPQPRLPLRLLSRVHERGGVVEFVYRSEVSSPGMDSAAG